MSSNTQLHIRARSEVKITVNGEGIVALDQVLGAGGAKILNETLANLPSLGRSMGEAGLAQFDWERVAGTEDSYQSKVNGALITLSIGSSIARIAHSYSRQIDPDQQAALTETIQTAVNQKVNQLLALAVSRRITEEMRVYVGARLREEVTLTVGNNHMLRTNAYFSRVV